jgi:hypothetical protein
MQLETRDKSGLPTCHLTVAEFITSKPHTLRVWGFFFLRRRLALIFKKTLVDYKNGSALGVRRRPLLQITIKIHRMTCVSIWVSL